MGNGYWNKVLRVDLTRRTTWVENPGEEAWQEVTGGAGYGAKVLLEETTRATDPLGPDNPLVFALGAYQAGNCPGNAKWTAVAKSPLTNTYGDSAGGADWGVQLKRAGYDALVIKGAASEPVYIVINNDLVEVKDAGGLWGLDAFETCSHVPEVEGDRRYGVVCIGPAGEKMVRIACLVADGHSFAGRCGLGAVMGSKKLKAIAVRGTQSVDVADASRLAGLTREHFAAINKVARQNGLRDHGTPNLCITAEAFGDMPIKYWSGDVWPEGAKALGAPNYTQVLNAKPLPCMNCPAGCHRDIEITEPSRYALKGPGPEYETVGMLGTNLLIDDPKAVAKANDVCNRLGIDTISAGAAVGLAMEAYERGWITLDSTGLALDWGNADAAIELVNQIGSRTRFGAVFSDGTLAGAARIHPDAPAIVAHVKGLDLPAHDARACWSLGVNYATGTRGACHMRGVTEDVEMGAFLVPELGIVKDWSMFFSPHNKVVLTQMLQDYCAWCNSLVICVFMVDGGELSMTSLVDIFNSITGWGYGIEDAMRAGARIYNLQRLVNIRDGHDRSTDTLPLKMRIPAKKGFRAGKAPVPIGGYLDEIYALRKWTPKGIPTRECIEELGLERYARLAGL